MIKVFVVIPSFDEEETVGKVVKNIPRIKDTDIEVLIVDDGSTDDTYFEAKKAGASVTRHLINLGQGTAIKTGAEIAIRQEADIIITLDADGQHDPHELKKFIDPIVLNEADLVIGSRFLGSTEKTPAGRLWGIKFFNFFLRIFGVKLTDSACGFRAYRSTSMQKILPNLIERRFNALEQLIQAKRAGLRIIEVPVNIRKRETGVSKKGFLRFGYGLLKSILRLIF